MNDIITVGNISIRRDSIQTVIFEGFRKGHYLPAADDSPPKNVTKDKVTRIARVWQGMMRMSPPICFFNEDADEFEKAYRGGVVTKG